jgi:hypothetical protein
MPRPTHKGQPTTLLTEIPPQNKARPSFQLGHFFLLSPRTTTFQSRLSHIRVGVWSITVASRLKLAQPAFAAVYQTSGINRWRRAQR